MPEEQTKAKATPAAPRAGGKSLTSRPVLKVAEATRAQGSRVEVCVTIRVARQRFEGVAAGVGVDLVELRLAAEATLCALHAAIGADRFSLVGIKRMHAFDADVILVALRDGLDGRRCIGAVPVRSTLPHGAAAAVLDAANRRVTAPRE